MTTALEPIHCISLHQPFASLVAEDIKTCETRGFPTRYTGVLGIQAARRTMSLREIGMAADAGIPLDATLTDPKGTRTEAGFRNQWGIPLGYLVAVTRMVGCVPAEHIHLDPDREHGWAWMYGEDDAHLPTNQRHVIVGHAEYEYGDLTEGSRRYAWLLENITQVDPPLPMKGVQGFWLWTPQNEAEQAVWDSCVEPLLAAA